MGSLKTLVLAGTAAFMIAPGAFAADLGPVPPPMLPPAAAPVEEFSGWYLRGDVGVGTMMNEEWFDRALIDAGGAVIQRAHADTPFIDVGVGYQWNNWLRTDVIGELRGATEVKSTDRLFNPFVPNVNGGFGSTQFDFNEAKLRSVVVMGNVYADLGTWWCLTPFIGAGIGAAGNTLSGLTDIGAFTDALIPGVGIGSDNTKWNFAWAVHAGVAFNVSNNLKLEMAYRFMHLGDAQAQLNCAVGTCLPIEIRNIEASDIKIGMRWLFNEPLAPPPVYPPLMRKG